MRRASQFTTFVSRLKDCADIKNIDEAKKVIQEGKLILRLPQLLPRDQISVLESFDKLGMPKSLWEAISTSFNDNLSKKLPFDVAKMGSILVKHVDHSKLNWSAIEDKLMSSSTTNLSFDPYLINVHTFLATAGKGSPEFWSKTESLCLESLENALNSDFKPQTVHNLLSKLVWSYAMAKHGSADFWRGVEKLIDKTMSQMTARNYSKMILAVSKVEEISPDVKNRLAKMAGFHTGDSGLSLNDLHDILLGLNMIDPTANGKAAKQVAEAVCDRLQAVGSFINSATLRSMYRILFELTEINEIDGQVIGRLQTAVAGKLNQMVNQKDLMSMNLKAKMYLATLPDLTPGLKGSLVESVFSDNPSAEDILTLEPSDFSLIAKFKRIAAGFDVSIESTLPSKIDGKPVFWINRFSACLAKFELSKLHSGSPNFLEELSQSYAKLVKEFEAMIKDQSVPPPKATDAVCKHLFDYLSGQATVQATLRRIARVYPTYTDEDLSTACCLLMTMIYLRHEDEPLVRQSTEHFVAKNSQILTGAPFLTLSVAALSKSLSVKDRQSTIRQVDRSSQLSTVNCLIFYHRLTDGRSTDIDHFIDRIDHVTSTVDDMIDAACRYLTDKYWHDDDKVMFDVRRPVHDIESDSIDFDLTVEDKMAAVGKGQDTDNPVMNDRASAVKTAGEIDLLAAMLIKLYRYDVDCDMTSTASIRSDSRSSSIAWSSISAINVNRSNHQSRKSMTDSYLADNIDDIDHRQ